MVLLVQKIFDLGKVFSFLFLETINQRVDLHSAWNENWFQRLKFKMWSLFIVARWAFFLTEKTYVWRPIYDMFHGV
jgi:hypothetical protein